MSKVQFVHPLDARIALNRASGKEGPLPSSTYYKNWAPKFRTFSHRGVNWVRLDDLAPHANTMFFVTLSVDDIHFPPQRDEE